ncbi:MAG: restriction endonuclease [Elusimicrobia bacterium]|nr:restriction endonuclease [Elusimicrobiota bacterium]MBU2615183.1 restriction endonuclease [Elusimicrobiota bacterium]
MGKIEQGIEILKGLGLPRQQQNERCSLTLLSLLDLKKNNSWEKSQKRIIGIHDILIFIKKNYNKKYAENTRETIRRQTLHQFEQAGIVSKNSDDPSRSTNSPATVYEITEETLNVIKKYGTSKWEDTLKSFISKKGKLIDKYEKIRKDKFLTLKIDGSDSIELSPGKHNELQIKVVKELKPRFFPKAELLYFGDTAKKTLVNKKDDLNKLGIPITKHDKLPDFVFYNKVKQQIILIEVVTSHGPISPKRQIELENTLKNCKASRIYISVFADFHEFKRHIDNIAWETEVWIAANPDHMIHFNGDKFFSVYNQ